MANSNTSDPWSSLFYGLLLYFFCWLLWHGVMDSKFRYALQYGTSAELVTVAKRQRGCDFMFAPVGDKGCEYEKTVVVVQRGTDNQTQRRTISYDEGKTWNWDDGDTQPVGTVVTVDWNKTME
jgi:hypothetical protein